MHQGDLTYPDFLGIGAMKAGTTWLFEVLSRHPGLWLPHVKEVHYFDREFMNPNPRFWDRLAGQTATGRGWRMSFRKKFLRAPDGRFRVRKYFGWDRHYYFGRPDDRWYARLFQAKGPRLAGDITPGYGPLEEGRIRHIQGLMPSAKIIFLLRHPAERAWSQARMVAHQRLNRRDLDLEDTDQVLEFLRAPYVRMHGFYAANLERWEKFYPRENFFIGFFEEIAGDPRGLCRRIFRFLGIEDSEAYLPEPDKPKVNEGENYRMPARVYRELMEMYAGDILRIQSRFGSYASGWLRSGRVTVP